MTWTWITSSHPISDIRDWSNQNRLEIQPDYQRRAVWSPAARILLMDTILRKIPIPKLFFEAIIREKDTFRKVIDGQQRIKSIIGFLNNEFVLAKPYKGDYFGKNFSQLPPKIQDEFLSYKIDINEIKNATEDVVREIYSRVNKYNVALNKQELRRADFPGDYLNLSEKIAKDSFFEDAKIFTIANSKRMGDVELVSELLALLLKGPQEKREKLDEVYIDYSEWDRAGKDEIEKRFLNVLKDLKLIFPPDPGSSTIQMMRFRQKADFYSLFAAIDDLRVSGNNLDGKDISWLQQDLTFLNAFIEPQSGSSLLSRYAILCVSQGNTIASRTWRRDFLKQFLNGTYLNKPPDLHTIKVFHRLIEEGDDPMCPPQPFTCPVCNKEDNNNYSKNVFLTWALNEKYFSFSNLTFIHNSCREVAKKDFFIWEPYTTDELQKEQKQMKLKLDQKATEDLEDNEY